MTKKYEDIVEKLIELYESDDSRKVESVIEGMRDADLADILSSLPEDLWIFVFREMDIDTASEVLSLVDEGVARGILARLEAEEIVPLVEIMASDDAADIINLLPDEKAPTVLRRISREDYEDVSELLKFDEETAGGLMARELLTVNGGMKIYDVKALIRKKAEYIENIQNIYVVDANEVLLGSIPLINLLVVDSNKRADEVMESDIVTVTSDTDQEQVAAIFSKYDLYTLPVVDRGGRLEGRITADDIMDVIEEEANEDITMMAGTGEEEFWERSSFKLSRARLPWLLTGLFGGIASAFVMNNFKESLESVLTLSFFIPVITAMAGNVGIQSSAIVVRELAVGGISFGHTSSKLLRELKVSLINGFVLASILMVIILAWQRDYKLGILLWLCMFFIICWSTVMGAMIPLLLKRRKIDPALATGPFITTSNDILGILIYLGIATLFLDWLG
ncbi:MAG: magnesium transporter [Candidatus Krumholzibacteriota bacterium]|nr:magnesium transporter [Candidatus Krumholzibacteriota bacterium]